MKKQLSHIALAIAFGISPQITYAQTHSHLTDEELQKLMPDFQRQVEYWNQYEEPERQNEAKAFAENWSRRDPTVALFLGKWAGWEQTMDIYPSTTDGQVCIIYTDETAQVVGFALGNVLNQRIYDSSGVTFRQRNYLGSAWNNNNPTGEAGIEAYRLFAPAEVPTRGYWRDWDEGDRVIEQFNAAGCIAEASNQESRRCVTWEEVKSEVESLYSQFLYSDRLGYSHPLPELPDGFKNGCVFGDSGASTIAISVSKDEVRTRIAEDYDTIFGVIPHYSSIVDVEPEIDENKEYLNFYNICSSVGTASTTFCRDLPTDRVYIKEDSVCLQKLCIKANSVIRIELVRLWNEALEQRQSQ